MKLTKTFGITMSAILLAVAAAGCSNDSSSSTNQASSAIKKSSSSNHNTDEDTNSDSNSESSSNYKKQEEYNLKTDLNEFFQDVESNIELDNINTYSIDNPYDNYFLNGKNNSSYQTIASWVKSQNSGGNIDDAKFTVQNLDLDVSTSVRPFSFQLKYNVNVSLPDGSAKVAKVFTSQWHGTLKKDSQGNYLFDTLVNENPSFADSIAEK